MWYLIPIESLTPDKIHTKLLDKDNDDLISRTHKRKPQ